jgi:hypothetical protein
MGRACNTYRGEEKYVEDFGEKETTRKTEI